MSIPRNSGFSAATVDEEGIFAVGPGTKLMTSCKEVDAGSCPTSVAPLSCEMIDDAISFADGTRWASFCVVRERTSFCTVRG